MGRIAGFSRRDRESDRSTETVRGWTLLDDLVVEVHVLTARFPATERDMLGRSLRAVAVQTALELLAAASIPAEAGRARVDRARRRLGSLRYHIYLARRLNLMDLRRYRALCARYDKADQTLGGLAGGSGNSGAPG